MTGFEALQQLRLPDAWQAEAIRALGRGRRRDRPGPDRRGQDLHLRAIFPAAARTGPGHLHRADARAGQRQIRRVEPSRLARRHHDRRPRARSRSAAGRRDARGAADARTRRALRHRRVPVAGRSAARQSLRGHDPLAAGADAASAPQRQRGQSRRGARLAAAAGSRAAT